MPILYSTPGTRPEPILSRPLHIPTTLLYRVLGHATRKPVHSPAYPGQLAELVHKHARPEDAAVLEAIANYELSLGKYVPATVRHQRHSIRGDERG